DQVFRNGTMRSVNRFISPGTLSLNGDTDLWNSHLQASIHRNDLDGESCFVIHTHSIPLPFSRARVRTVEYTSTNTILVVASQKGYTEVASIYQQKMTFR